MRANELRRKLAMPEIPVTETRLIDLLPDGCEHTSQVGICRECVEHWLVRGTTGLQRQLTEAHVTIHQLKGALAAQDEREQKAGDLCGVSRVERGCDWPDAMAERVIVLEATIAALHELIARLASVDVTEDDPLRFIVLRNQARELLSGSLMPETHDS